MKRYNQLLKELPSKKVVFAFGRFQPPTNGHALLVNAVTRLAKAQGADHVIYASRSNDKKSNPLAVDRKVYYLKRMFPNTTFVAADDNVRTFIEAAKHLNKTYKNLIMVAGSDRIAEYKRILDKYNGESFDFDTIEVVSAGERDPDSDTAAGMSGTKMREAAKKGDFAAFKKGLPHTLTDHDGRRLMNDVREGMGLEAIKESIQFKRHDLREKYHAGLIFKVGDKVLFEGHTCEVVKRGSNHILIQLPDSSIQSKWLHQVQIYEDITPGDIHDKEIEFNGYTTKNFNHSEDAAKAFIETISRIPERDMECVLTALRATDKYMGLNDKAISGTKLSDAEREEWLAAHEKAREELNKIGEFAHHLDYWHMHRHEMEDAHNDYIEKADQMEEETKVKYTASDKIKVARVIATSLGHDPESSTNPELLVNTALRRMRNKTLSKQGIEIVHNMLKLAGEAGIKYDDKLFKTPSIEEAVVGSSLETPENQTLRKMKIKHHLGEEDDKEEDEFDMSDEDIDKMLDSMKDDDFLDAYDDEELGIIDDDTGEEAEDEEDDEDEEDEKEEVKESKLNEVLSRAERIKTKVRFMRTKSKRERRLRIALKTRSNTKKVNDRAKRMAIKTLKQRIAKKPLEKLSVAEKERLERFVQRNPRIINRIALKMVPKIRRLETDRLTHKSYTK